MLARFFTVLRPWIGLVLVTASATVSASALAFYCFAGGVYSGFSNLGTSSVTIRTTEKTSCGDRVYDTKLNCAGVLVGSPNVTTTLIREPRCMWI